MSHAESLRQINDNLEEFLARAAAAPGTVREPEVAKVSQMLAEGGADPAFRDRRQPEVDRYIANLLRLRAAVESINSALMVQRSELRRRAEHLRNAAACANAYKS